MSNYSKITRHPVTAKFEVARYRDDYFGSHLYGVEFSDGRTYPIAQVEAEQIKEFWVADVINAIKSYYGDDDEQVVDFLDVLNSEYRDRWERDPDGGEGAADYYVTKFSGKAKRA